MKLTRLILTAAMTAALAAPAIAHEGKKHAATAATVKKEQKPWGVAGDAKSVTRTITLAMTDNMRFSPDRLDIKRGETIKFIVRNDGKMLHEMVIGTKQELEKHAALMLKFPDMEHEEPYMVHVPPGTSGEIIWTFNRTGDFEFACLIAGHYQAGMKGVIRVAGK